jgi:hypothetical protein
MPRIMSINKACASGTCLQGYLNSSYEDIVKTYGEPNQMVDGFKTDVQWTIKWVDGSIGTIYNWKNGRNYMGELGLDVANIKEWNIGGDKKIVVKRIIDDVKNSWPVFDNIRMDASD